MYAKNNYIKAAPILHLSLQASNDMVSISEHICVCQTVWH